MISALIALSSISSAAMRFVVIFLFLSFVSWVFTAFYVFRDVRVNLFLLFVILFFCVGRCVFAFCHLWLVFMIDNGTISQMKA